MLPNFGRPQAFFPLFSQATFRFHTHMKPLPLQRSSRSPGTTKFAQTPLFVVPLLGGSGLAGRVPAAKSPLSRLRALFQVSIVLSALLEVNAAELRLGTNQTPADWRAEKRLIDLHQHIGYTPERLKRAVKIMDASGIGIGVNLSGGTVTSTNNALSAFEQNS